MDGSSLTAVAAPTRDRSPHSVVTTAGSTRSVLALLDHRKTLVCGIVNVTPDSFADGGLQSDPGSAVEHALTLVNEGADMLDIGGESTRPGAIRPSLDEELSRVIPVVRALTGLTVPLSVDTSRPEVMIEAVAAGATMINDVRSLGEGDAAPVAAQLGVPVCLTHMRGEPRTMQLNPQYDDVVDVVCSTLARGRSAAIQAGVDPSKVILDPGFGFGKRLADNLDLFVNLPRIVALGSPVMVGLSRKAMLGSITGQPVAQRQTASVVAAVLAAKSGARIVRVHDVRDTVDGLGVLSALDGRTDEMQLFR